jgi:DUF4097 and DUF4098 domain-containing protein YvlB
LHAPAIKLHRHMATVLCAGAFLLAAGCANGPSVDGSFDRSYNVTGHTRMDIGTASGDITITGSADGKVHVHGDIKASGSGQQDAQKRLADIEANPPVEQTSEGLRIGRDAMHLHDASITYTIEAPPDTEVSGTSASGSLTVRGIKGPVKLQSASGSVHAQDIQGEAQLASNSGAVTAANMGAVVRASSDSGDVSVNDAKGDVRAKDESGNIHISGPGSRVEAENTSGNVDVQGATSDAKAHSVSGNVAVRGNPSANSYWDLKTISGNAAIGVASGSNFHLLAESTSGEIRADIPIMIEEQGKHSLRAQIGSGGGRVEVHTVTGEIHLAPF